LLLTHTLPRCGSDLLLTHTLPRCGSDLLLAHTLPRCRTDFSRKAKDEKNRRERCVFCYRDRVI